MKLTPWRKQPGEVTHARGGLRRLRDEVDQLFDSFCARRQYPHLVRFLRELDQPFLMQGADRAHDVFVIPVFDPFDKLVRCHVRYADRSEEENLFLKFETRFQHALHSVVARPHCREPHFN